MALNVVGLLLGIVPIAMLPGDFRHDKGKPDVTSINIGAGFQWMNEIYFSTGGNVPAISLFDENGARIGQHKPSKGEKILQGRVGPVDIKSSQAGATGAGIQSEYISLTMDHNDALCISFISMVWPDNLNTPRAWYGDVGYKCGGDWYHSELIAGDKNYKPKCTWLDANHSNKLRFQGMGIHISDFEATDARTRQYQKHPDTMCKSQPRFHLYENLEPDDILPVFFPPLVSNEDLTDTDFTKVIGASGVMADGARRPGTVARRSVKKDLSRRRKLEGRSIPGQLVRSQHATHSARELCESETSFGPDFVSFAESLFCDMNEREVWPLCSNTIPKACFDTETNSMREGGRQRRDESSGRLIPEKQYTAVNNWKGRLI